MTRRRFVLCGLVWTLSSAVLTTPALASDGVLEINQTCAVETGCFPGDSPGLPVTISNAGSYRLTSNLDVPNENTDGIVVGAGGSVNGGNNRGDNSCRNLTGPITDCP